MADALEPPPPPRILVIAGSDSGGGAGIQADIKTIMALGGYATTAITALTAQNTQKVEAIFPTPVDYVKSQVTTILEDIGTDCIKTGMLFNTEIIRYVGELLQENPKVISVIDPVLRATTGATLSMDETITAYKEYIFPYATIVTPNIPEAELLTGRTIRTVNDMQDIAFIIHQLGCKAVLLKGGHLDNSLITDVLYDGSKWHFFSHHRVGQQAFHGTGCTLASAIACYLAKQHTIEEAVEQARHFVVNALNPNLKIGKGHSPLNHASQLVTS